MRPSGCGRDEYAHALVANARMGVGKVRIDQIMDGDHSTKGPGKRGGGGKAVQEGNPRTCRLRGKQHLLAQHPLHPVAGMHRHRDCGQKLSPRPVACSGGLAVDERREPHPLRRRVEQRWDHFARGDLHPPRLAGDQEDQVEADVNRGSAQAAQG